MFFLSLSGRFKIRKRRDGQKKCEFRLPGRGLHSSLNINFPREGKKETFSNDQNIKRDEATNSVTRGNANSFRVTCEESYQSVHTLFPNGR